uniref:UMP-CMP kinase 2, mitochondrial n=1 Tax=Leptobrachium leishanense TaxID=445787 RepID=A0A8C5PS55_9ANUR
FVAVPNPVYFTSFESNLIRERPHEWPMLSKGVCAHSLCITNTDRIYAARLHKTLGQKLALALQGDYKILRLFSYLPWEMDGSLQMGYFVLSPQGPSSIHARLADILVEHQKEIRFCSYRRDAEEDVQGCLWDFNGEGKEQEPCQLARIEEPDPSPLVLNIMRSALFYKLEDVLAVLRQCFASDPQVLCLQEKMKKERKDIDGKRNFPVIVIEGLDGTGKSTLTKSLQDALNATLLNSPPECISPWRKAFDDEPSLLRRAYYGLGNYIVADQISEAAQSSPVIVDRYWHSTAAYSIGTEIGGGLHNLPAHHHEVYQWPKDLLKPDLVILLTVSDEERMQRMCKRGLAKTVEEKELESNSLFRQKVEEAYKRMERPGCVVVDASGPKKRVFNDVLSIVCDHCNIHVSNT